MKKWTEEEIAVLKQWYPIKGAKYCSESLNRSYGSIRNKVKRLSLLSKSHPNRKKTELEYLEQLSGTDYILLDDYINSSTKTLHEHSVCGHSWKVTPNNLLTKLVGCPKCSKSGFKATTPSFVYLCYFPELNLYKIGLTVNWDKRKYDFGEKVELVKLYEFATGTEAAEFEKELLFMFQDCLIDIGMLKNGNTETFMWGSYAA